jgi:thioredoxin 1
MEVSDMTEREQTFALDVTDSSFDHEVLGAKEPVLVDFWANWCAPCRIIAPIVEELASEYDGRLKVRKLNVDDNSHTTARFGVRGIPTLMLFKDGELKEVMVGVRSKAQLAEAIDPHVAVVVK